MWMNRMVNLLIGAAIGAIVVGGSWFYSAHQNSVIATVDNTSIQRSDFNTQLENAGGSQILSQLIANQLIRDGAKKYNITASQKEIDDAINQMKQQYGITSDDQLNQSLAQNHMTMQEFRDNMEIQVLEKKLGEKDVNVTPAEIKDYYNKNKDQLATQESVTASHILVKTEAEANQVEQRLKKGEDFAKVAKEVSIDPGSKNKGGDLGTFTKGQMDPDFEKAAFALKPGQISAPVHTQYGWHIIKVTAHQPAKVPTLAEATPKITDTLKSQKAVQPQQVVANLAKQFKVTIMDPKFQDVITQLENPQSTTSGGQ
jgi:foldase protein PrsA